MKKILLALLFLLPVLQVNGQSTEKVWRVNFLNPGIVYELPVSFSSIIAINAGIGYSGSYPKLTKTKFQTGILYAIVPFLDVQYRFFYNLKERAREGKLTAHNSGNFISLRFKVRGPSIDDNFIRKTSYDFAIGPTWGIQRSYGNFNLLISVGPQLYFDMEGNVGFWPVMPHIALGFNL